ncbi:hypothetical protein [Cellulomonas endophytica]|uniref:hypothetical protein n=1 Tax=Cellulomonas endophytica TaxID=2494735 RepID=UPI001010E70F|nr:hypothetical protein [Cellulomonas endophytica]
MHDEREHPHGHGHGHGHARGHGDEEHDHDHDAAGPAAPWPTAPDVGRVFGPAWDRGDALVIPVARVRSATASGRYGGPLCGSGGSATGSVRPLGVYVVDDGGAHWHPALDLGRVVAGGQVAVAVVGVAFALAHALRRR